MSSDAPYCIMLINGSQEMLQLLRELIEELGNGQYTCELQALDDPNQVEKIREVQPDLVVIDQPFHDPRLDGWELVQKIRLARDLKDLPVVFTTTNVGLLHDLDAQLAALNIRAILKPFDPDTLMLQIRRILEPETVLGDEATKGDRQDR